MCCLNCIQVPIHFKYIFNLFKSPPHLNFPSFDDFVCGSILGTWRPCLFIYFSIFKIWHLITLEGELFCIYVLLYFRVFIEERLGPKYTEGRSVDFAKSYQEASPTTPIFFILSPGVDPLKVSKNVCFPCNLFVWTIQVLLVLQSLLVLYTHTVHNRVKIYTLKQDLIRRYYT